MKKVIVISGPTGVGKTDLSLELCKLYNGEVINADASQFRKKLNVGTAKLDITTTSIPHHLFDFLNPTDPFSIKDYQVLARRKIEEVIAGGKLPFLVGGSGLYIKSVIQNYQFTESERNYDFENQYDKYNNEELHKELEKIDLQSSINIHPNNRRRVLRAIEIGLSSKKLLSNNITNDYIYDALQLCLITNRDILYDRINRRFDKMIESGWLDEVKGLMDVDIDMKAIKEIGYYELSLYLQGEIELEETKELIKQKTRRYAKRQITWFTNKMNSNFIEMDYENPKNNLDYLISLIDEFLK